MWEKATHPSRIDIWNSSRYIFPLTCYFRRIWAMHVIEDEKGDARVSLFFFTVGLGRTTEKWRLRHAVTGHGSACRKCLKHPFSINFIVNAGQQSDAVGAETNLDAAGINNAFLSIEPQPPQWLAQSEYSHTIILWETGWHLKLRCVPDFPLSTLLLYFILQTLPRTKDV